MRFKNLEKYRVGGTATRPQLSLPIPKTPSGRVYRYSPNETAPPRHFVLGGSSEIEFTHEMRTRMKLEPRSKQTVCPYSGVIAEDEEFTHPTDRQAAIDTVRHAVVEDMRAELQRMLSGVARKSGGIITYKPGRSSPKPKPRFTRRDLMRELECDHCGRDYGVYAISLFCPDCGAPNLRLHFRRETELVVAQVSLAEELPEEQHELAYRLIGNAHEDVLTAFETTLKTVYLYGMSRRPDDAEPFKPVANDFQNVARARARFADLAIDPFDALESEALAALELNVQKRHVIGHNLGVADPKFAQHARDARVGETIHLVGEDVRIFAGICQVVISQLDTWLAGGISAPEALSETTSKVELMSEHDPVTAESDDLGLSPLAYRIALWLAENLADGRGGPLRPDALAEASKDEPLREVQDALAELAADGYVKTTNVTGPEGLPRVLVNLELFATFDPIVSGDDPSMDAASLAGFALEMDGGVSASALHEKSGWPIRRFNPALSTLAEQVDDRRVSKGHDEKYSVSYFVLTADDRVSLKRYIARLS